MHKISLICPVKNEENFLPIHFDNFINKVDEIVYCDTGSTDKTPELLNGFKKRFPDKVKLLSHEVKDAYRWEEGAIRQFIVDSARNDIILNADADEVVSDNFCDIISKYDIGNNLIEFDFIPFWKNLETIRCNVENDNRWYPNHIARIFNRRKYSYQTGGNHSFLKCNYGSFERLYIEGVKYFHLHYAMFKRCKPNDNRLGDLGLKDYWGRESLPDDISDDNLDYLLTTDYRLKTIPYAGIHPLCLQKFTHNV